MFAETETRAHDFLFSIRFDENGRWRVIKIHQMTAEQVAEHNKAPEPDD